MPSKMTYEYFVKKARKNNGDKYIYPNDILENRKDNGKVGIFCPVKDEDGNPHGIFWQIPSNHFKGCGCPKCGKNHKPTTEEFKEEIRKLYPNSNIILDKIKYINNHTMVELICPIHGVFTMLPSSIKENMECPECQKIRLHDKFSKSPSVFMEEIKSIFKDTLDYSKAHYINNKTDVELICKKHGLFTRSPLDLLKGKGCPKCSYAQGWDKRGRMTIEEVIDRANKTHGMDRFYYGDAEYISAHTPIKIKCNKCGNYFYQDPYAHINGQGCPFCKTELTESSGEIEMYNFIKENLNNNLLKNDRRIIYPYEIDIYSPAYKIGIEYNGLYWHSSDKVKNDYHLSKSNKCLNKGIRLIHIFEDEWLNKKEIVQSMLSYIFHKNINRIYARKCYIDTVSEKDSVYFLIKNNLFYNNLSNYRYGLYFNNELVCLMTFDSLNANEKTFILSSFTNKLNTSVVGGMSKLLRCFINHIKPRKIITYANRRWSNGEIFYKLGFNFIKSVEPDFYYLIDNKRIKPSLLTSNDLSDNKKLKKIYNCGYNMYEKIISDIR